MQVHIGKKIRERAEVLKIKPTELAARINTSKQNMYGIFKRQTIDTGLLQQLGKALDFDFFSYYQKTKTSKLVEEGKNPQYEVNAGVQFELKTLKTELAELKEKFNLLKDVVDLLKKRI